MRLWSADRKDAADVHLVRHQKGPMIFLERKRAHMKWEGKKKKKNKEEEGDRDRGEGSQDLDFETRHRRRRQGS
jgi:hypothetical protein